LLLNIPNLAITDLQKLGFCNSQRSTRERNIQFSRRQRAADGT
jgi:hypothetical protein